ncbi:MAG: hypothetical protein FD172_3518 [Methylocystaceae bacterium]|nr:MAG: hypothetical protein FD172_3518 [Methylocystaceae bacterium]
MRVAQDLFVPLFWRNENELSVERQEIQPHNQPIAVIEAPGSSDRRHELIVRRLLRPRVVHGAGALRLVFVSLLRQPSRGTSGELRIISFNDWEETQ